jgi:hypothetical protein
MALAAATPASAQPAAAQPVTALALPDGEGGIGFDDLRYDAASNLVLVPAGRTGRVDLIDPASRRISEIPGFSSVANHDAGHGQSVTSVDVGGGYLFATDRTARKLAVVDLKTRKIVLTVPLASPPDYIRYVPTTRELWVTEPRGKRIELFSLSSATPPVPTHAAFIDTPLKTRAVVATWPAGCAAPRGIALDESSAILLIGCEDGTATALDVDHDGKLLGTLKSGRGVDIIAYDPKRAHLYLPGDESATMAIIGVSAQGALSLLGVVPTAKEAHCATIDGRGGIYVCDPRSGRLLVVDDRFPKSR